MLVGFLRIRLRWWVGCRREIRALRRERRRRAQEILKRGRREPGPGSVDLRLQRDGTRPEFERMLARLAIDRMKVPADLLPPLWDAARACALCQDVRRCRRWLAQTADSDAPRRFCPNAGLFEEIARSLAQQPATTAHD